MNVEQKKFIKTMTNSLSFSWFLLNRLPSILFWGVRISELSTRECAIRLPYRWSTKNPFKSIYFAALSGAAELASGVLCMLHLTGPKKFSMLVTGFQAEFLKKADQPITFICDDGDELADVLATMAEPGQTATLTMSVRGINKEGIPVATFQLTWSFKRKV